MIEEEHKRLFCPDSRVPVPLYRYQHFVAANRTDNGEPLPGTLCLGSRCAAWRWSDGLYEFQTSEYVPSGDGWEPVISVNSGRWKRLLGPSRQGFCGKYEPMVQL
jgi:hypothetical protein